MTSAPTILPSTPRGLQQPQTTSQLNVRLAVISVIVVTVSAIFLYFWHGFQVKRLSGSLIDVADQREQEEQWFEAAVYLHRYLRLQPDDGEIKVRLAQTFDRLVEETPQRSREAIPYFVNAVDAAPDQIELRERLVELLLDVRRYSVAKEAAQKLEEKDPGNSVAARVQLLAEFREAPLTTQTEIQTYADRFQAALASHPEDVSLAMELARIYRDRLTTPGPEERARLADEVIDQMVAAAPQRPESYIERYSYRTNHELDGKEADVQEALRLAPEDRRVLLMAGTSALEAGQLVEGEERAKYVAEAQKHYQKVIELFPTVSRGYLGLGDSYILGEENEKAINAWRTGLDKANPDDIMLNHRLALLMFNLQRTEDAARYFNRLKTVSNQLLRLFTPDARTALQQMIDLPYANFLISQGDYRTPIPLLRDVLLHSSGSDLSREEQFRGWSMLGYCYKQTNQRELAAYAFERMNAFGAADDSTVTRVSALTIAAEAAKSARNFDKALQLYDQARQLRPDNAEIWFGMAETFMLREKSRPHNQRNYGRVARFFRDPPDSVKGHPRFILQQIDLLLAQGGPNSRTQALGFLRRAEREFAAEPNFLYRIAIAYQQLGLNQDVQRVQQLVHELDNSGQLSKKLRVDLGSIAGNVAQAEESLLELIEASEGAERTELKRSLSQLYLGAKNNEKAIPLLEEIAEEDPKDTLSRLALAELAIHADEWATAEKWEQQLAEIEGDQGSMWKQIKATRLMYQADVETEDRGSAQLDAASELQVQVQRQRPEWAPGYLLAGQIADKRMQGLIDVPLTGLTEKLAAEMASLAPEQLVEKLGQLKLTAETQDNQELADQLQTLTEAASDTLPELAGKELSKLSLPELRLFSRELASTELNGQIQGLLSQIREKQDQAISNYERSMELGLSQVNILRRLLGLYRLSENEEGIAATEKRLAVHIDGLKMNLVSQLTAMLASGDSTELAKADGLKAQIERLWPNDVNLRLQIAKALEENRLHAQAELWYIAARDMQPKELRLWDELFTFYGRLSDLPSAVSVLEAVAQEEAIDIADRLFMVGRAYESLSQVEEASQAFVAYLNSDQQNANRELSIARFYADRNPKRSQQILNRIVQRDPINGEARRQLAAVLAADGAPEDWRRIRQLLDTVSGNREESLANRRHHVELLIQAGEPQQRATAVRILASLIKGDAQVDPQDVLLLAKLHEEDGNWDQAKEVFQVLTERDGAELEHRALYAEALLRNKEWQAAAEQIKQIDQQNAGSLRALELKVQYYRIQGQSERIAAVVDEFGKSRLGDLDFFSPGSEERALGQIGDMLSDADLHHLAEAWYRRVMELNPVNYQKLALSLAAQGKWSEALDLYEAKALERSARDAAMQLAYGLQRFKLPAENYTRANSLVERALREVPNDIQLLKASAIFRAAQEDRASAEKTYRKALKLSETDILVLNNLAYLICRQPDRQAEALELIDKAIELAGTQSVLLDTKAMILLESDPQQALQLLERAVRQYWSNEDNKATTLMHLAAAYRKNGENDKAQEALKRAQQSGLNDVQLEEQDRKLLAELSS